MVRKLILILGIMAVVGMVVGCGNLPFGEKEQPQPVQKESVAREKPAAGAPAEAQAPSGGKAAPPEKPILEEVKEVLVKKTEEFIYNPINKTDPFQPFRPETAKRFMLAEMPQAELMGQYELRSLKLVAIVWGTIAPVAMFETPDSKAYSVKVGDVFSRDAARVLSISPDGVLVEIATGRMATGEIAYQKLMIKLRGEEQEREIAEALLSRGKSGGQ